MTLVGKGFFIWKIRDCERGDPQAIATAAQQAGFTHILIKIADGNYPSNIDNTTRTDLVPPVVQALRSRGIHVWGWHYVYGYDPLGEARMAIRRVQELGLEGYVIDAEAEYKAPGRGVAARKYTGELRKSLPNLPIALSSFRFPTYHPQLPWSEFLERCDYNMPQVYWERAHNPAAQMARVFREFQALKPYRPVIPTGPAYKWNGWRPTEVDFHEFLKSAQELKAPAVNFFSWDECRRDLPDLWEIVARSNFGKPNAGSPGEPPTDFLNQYLQALNSRAPDLIASLYRPDAVHITAARTIQGQASIRSWYESLLTTQLPGATFTLTSSDGSGNSRRLTWRASSQKGQVDNGSDTIGLLDGKIAYHYTSYTIHAQV